MSVIANTLSTRTSLAILTMPDPEQGFRGNRANFIDLIQTGKKLGAFVYVLTTDDLRAGDKRVYGYVYNVENGIWTRQLLPMPHVIYNRLPTRTDEQLPEVQNVIKDCLKKKNVRLFNPYFFNKWALFEWLNSDKETQRFIPATRRLSSPQELASFMQSHPMVYLKPIRGKAGKGIMRLETNTPGRKYWCKLIIQNHKKSIVTNHLNFAKLWTRIKQEITDEDYIIQQGILLAESEGRPFDLRVLVQKSGTGKWFITGIGARVAGVKSITTHVPRGGHIDNPHNALISSFGETRTPIILRKVNNAALTIARRIEKASGYKLGEMSLDLGVDRNGRIWFFEANSRPMKFDEPDIRETSLARIIEYTQFLSRPRPARTGKKSG
ncbi:YheC/YheD family endospore coat-associated protein [Gorillibacterium timonense]|uniref:YheC/YheD family endospore coat-associated protein n=1 Tax=Gorillibacterium timonense TaxID=1689269 RepID=UPI000A9DC52B|nr:YheC/YheD family protein [Gorillibacterium timonense]